MSDLQPFRVQECGEDGCSCGGACGGDGASKPSKGGKRKARLRKLAEAWGVTPKPGGMAAPKRQRGSGTTPPKLPGLGGGTPARATARHGGDNSVSRPPTPPTPPQAKMARPPVKRWDGTSKRPRIGGALSAKGRKTLTEGELQEYNPYHGKGGKFVSKGQAVQTVAYGGKGPGGLTPTRGAKLVAAAEKAGLKPEGSSLMRQDAKRSFTDKHSRASGLFGRARKDAQGVKAGTVNPKAAASSKALAYQRRAEASMEGGKRQAPEHRERVEQNPKKFTKRMSSGKNPGEGVRRALSPLERHDRKLHGEGTSTARGSHALAARQAATARGMKRNGVRGYKGTAKWARGLAVLAKAEE